MISFSNIKIIKASSMFYIYVNGKPAKWASGFSSVQCAEDFIQNRTDSNTDENNIRIAADDVEFIVDTYGFEGSSDGWSALSANNGILFLKYQDNKLYLTIQQNNSNDTFEFDSTSDILEKLDEYFPNIIENSMICNKSQRFDVITAASNARQVAKNLVRTRSSNIWSFGCDVKKEGKDKLCDVYIQFKGRNGGPEDIYMYFDVPMNLWRRFLGAPSKGAFFWRYIRNSFLYRKLTGNKRGVLPNAVN